MAKQIINIGGYANDGTGDDLRTAFEKVKSNFDELYEAVGVVSGDNLGDGVGIFYQRNSETGNLEFKSLTSSDESVDITETDTEIDLVTRAKLENDLTPKLGGDLNLNGYNVYGGDVQTTIFGIDVQSTTALIEILLASNSVVLDFGSFVSGTVDIPDAISTNLDFNGATGVLDGYLNPNSTNVDLGTF